MRSKCVLNKNTYPDSRTQTQKLFKKKKKKKKTNQNQKFQSQSQPTTTKIKPTTTQAKKINPQPQTNSSIGKQKVKEGKWTELRKGKMVESKQSYEECQRKRIEENKKRMEDRVRSLSLSKPPDICFLDFWFLYGQVEWSRVTPDISSSPVWRSSPIASKTRSEPPNISHTTNLLQNHPSSDSSPPTRTRLLPSSKLTFPHSNKWSKCSPDPPNSD